ncbi:MAG: class I SAM-dependent methyltransferase [Bacteroidota bacterium]
MTAIKTRLKNVLEITVGSVLIKQMHFKFERTVHYFRNQQYKKKNPSFIIPHDRWLFETFQLNYQQYFEDGKLAAKEILNWTQDFLPKEMPTILDWGCGTGRIVQHLHSFDHYLLLYGADINHEIISWNHQNIKGVHFSLISLITPTDYPDNYFDLIYGISVFTHTPSNQQKDWINEMNRIIKPSGILMVSTMGAYFNQQLFTQELKQLAEHGIFEKEFKDKGITAPGNRNYSVYETAAFFEKMITEHFNIIHFYEGSSYPEKFGGQDLWILQKK